MGILKPMTDKSLDEKLITTFQQQQVEVDRRVAEFRARPESAENTTAVNKFIVENSIDIHYRYGRTLFFSQQRKLPEIGELTKLFFSQQRKLPEIGELTKTRL